MVRVMPSLLERQVELQTLGTAVERAGLGRGSAVLVLGEAGIGKTSLVHAFLTAAAGRARVLAGACEDLLTPRALGPLRDAARSAADGPLAAALSPRADPALVFAAVCDELASPPSPTVLVIEDAHWADGATLDVLRYLGPRVQNLPAVLLMTYRDDALARDHPLRGVLGVLGSTAATRLRLTRLTSDAVRDMAASTNLDPGELFRLTGGNPFFVTEVLANPCEVVPPTVVDAVLARVRTLSPPAQTALDRLAVVPSGAEVDLLRILVGDLAPVAEAERAGVVDVRGDVVAFRHELARRAVVESLPASVRLELNADVLRALLVRPDCDPFRVLHHAVEAGDDAAVITHGQAAAQEAARVGAHRQAAACYLSGCDELLRSMAQATDLGNHEYVMRAYYNLIEGLWRLGEYREALGYIEQAQDFGRYRDFRVHGYMFAARRCRLALMRGQWAEAEAGLRELLDGQGDPGMIGRETVPILARVLVRQGSADAPEWLGLAARHAAQADVLEWLVPTGLAHIEHAWLTDDHGQAGPYPELLLERTDRPGALVQRGELLVYLRRLGYPAGPFPCCPEPYASALRGDWRSAADAWLSEGDPYEGAVELAGSGQVEPTLEALTVLDGLGAKPAVAMVRSRLRGLGVARLPRRPQPGTLTNPAGLTDRELEILRLVATGLSNAEIARRLVVSPRTVDHHVSAILRKLGVHTRRDAAAWAGGLESPPSPRGVS
jgi:DNA-binding CsgD family transcriptional regulator